MWNLANKVIQVIHSWLLPSSNISRQIFYCNIQHSYYFDVLSQITYHFNYKNTSDILRLIVTIINKYEFCARFLRKENNGTIRNR